jgi:hypothetical protein
MAMRFLTVAVLFYLPICLPTVVAAVEPPVDPEADAITSARQLASLLEKRWPVESIKHFCTPETRFDPFDWNLPAWQGEIWHGFMHVPQESEIGKVYWYALVKDGHPDRISINVIGQNDHWHLETLLKMKEVFEPIDARRAIQFRVKTAIATAVSSSGWGAIREQGEIDDWRFFIETASSDGIDDKDTFEYAPNENTIPVKYIRQVRSEFFGRADSELAVVLGKDATPIEFYVDKKKDECLAKIYSLFAAKYSTWLNTLVYGYETSSPNANTSWFEHLEALGISEDCAQYLDKQPLEAGAFPENKGRPHSLSQEISQPDYTAWNKVAKGMTEAEVFAILGAPQYKETRHTGGYIWHYGTVVHKSQVMPEPYEFRIWLVMGRVDGIDDPFDGHFSSDGSPSTPVLIHPQDGEEFSNFPRFVDLRWYPSSGEYPMRYEIEANCGVTEKTTTEPYASLIGCGMNTVSWRVRAVNAKGKSEWSESRKFECLR